MSGLATLSAIALDCPDPLALAGFYSQLSGWPLNGNSDETWAQLDTGGQWTLAFQRVDGYQAPQWPGQDVPQQFHLDFDVADLDDGERQVVALGATKAEHQPGTTFRVFLDPAGHPFCLCIS
jgi:predicted enzyme related to lactoylglutathione lyase